MIVYMYTDGACSGNPGSGAYATIIKSGLNEIVLSEAFRLTTNNRMEIMGVIAGLKTLLRQREIVVCSDSKYVIDTMREGRLQNWKRKSWRTKAGVPVANIDLWQDMDRLAAEHVIRWHWIRGHDGHPMNERVDRLARAAIRDLRHQEDIPYVTSL